MRDITIREATMQDSTIIMELIWELAKYERLEHEVTADANIIEQNLFGQAPRAFALIAEEGSRPVGFCLYFYNFSTFVGRLGIYIEDIFVRPECRGLGIGKQLFARLGEIAEANQCGRIEWWVLDWNKDAIAFYESFGAEAMSEWSVYRLTRDKFRNLKAPITCTKNAGIA